MTLFHFFNLKRILLMKNLSWGKRRQHYLRKYRKIRSEQKTHSIEYKLDKLLRIVDCLNIYNPEDKNFSKEQLRQISNPLCLNEQYFQDLKNQQFRFSCYIETLYSSFIFNKNSVFLSYENRYINQDIVIFATGPTLKYCEHFCNTVNIGVNKSFLFEKNKLDFLFMQDFGSVKDYISKAQNYNCVKFYGVFLDESIDNLISIPKSLIEKHSAKTYFNSFPNNQIHKNISRYALADFGSVVFPALNFALYTNPRRIFLVGCDCSNAGYFDNSKQSSELPVDAIYNGYKQYQKFSSLFYPGIEIVSVNPVGLKGLFHDVYTENYLAEHPEIDPNSVEILRGDCNE